MKPVVTLVLLANDAHARLFENHGVGKGLTEVDVMAKAVLPDGEIHYSDRPARSASADGTGRHGVEPRTSEHDQMLSAFADNVVAEVGARWNAQGYDRFVMAASPRMLGALRERMPRAIADNLAFDLDKDYLKSTPQELVAQLADHIAF